MARSDLLINLVRAGTQGDHATFRRTIEAIVAEERGRQHHVLAERLAEYLQAPRHGATGAPRTTSDAPFGAVHEIAPTRTLRDLILPPIVRTACAELVEEQQRADLLRARGVEPRHRVLAAGAPGNGKTTLAEALAGELSVPLLVVRYEAVIASYLGETALRLAKLFDYVRTRRCVLFFDEFDAIGKERGDQHETGEIKRAVSSLLLAVDGLPPYVVVVAATNHPELLDRAVWRRFQIRVELPVPSKDQIEELIDRFQTQEDFSLRLRDTRVAEQLEGLSFAEIESFLDDIRRRRILAGPDADLQSIVSSRLDQWMERSKVRR